MYRESQRIAIPRALRPLQARPQLRAVLAPERLTLGLSQRLLTLKQGYVQDTCKNRS